MEMGDLLTLANLWAAILAFAVLAYVVLDGFDLGVGILFPFLRKEEERDLAMATIAPVWDGNETWLVLGGGGLFAVFPLAYGILFTALYPLIIAMLLGLIFRGVAFEFIPRTPKHRHWWDFAFFGGSLVAAIAQGMALGAIVQGIAVEGRAYAGGNWDWFSPFSLLTAAALVVGYAVLGATWLDMKTEGTVQRIMHRLAMPLFIILMLFLGVVSLATPFLHPVYFERWFAWPTMAFSFIVPLLVLGCAWMFRRGWLQGRAGHSFLATIGIFVLGFIGLGISFYPYLVPPSLTIAEAAAPDVSLRFLLVGTVVLVPLILAYTAWSYWVFRGKVKPGEGYH